MKKSEDRAKWTIAPIDGKNVELNDFDWLDGIYDMIHLNNRHAIYLDSGLVEMVENKDNLLIANVSATTEDWEDLSNIICEEVNDNEYNEGLYAEFSNATDSKGNNIGFITFYWT